MVAPHSHAHLVDMSVKGAYGASMCGAQFPTCTVVHMSFPRYAWYANGFCKANDHSCGRAMDTFFDAPQRDDEWLRWMESHPVPALESAVEVLRAPATEEVLEEAWREAGLAVACHTCTALENAAQAEKVAKSNSCEVVEAVGRFIFRYFQHLPAARQVAKDLENVLLDCGGTALEVAAVLLLARDGSQVAEAIKLLAASKAKSSALRLAVARHSNGDPNAAAGLVASANQELNESNTPNTRLLSMFGFLGAVSGQEGDLAMSALETAQRGSGRGALEARLYAASMKGLIPFPLCKQIFLLERDLLFQPSSCLHRLELAVLLQQGAAALKVPEALVLAKDFLSRLPLNCPALASELSGMGMAWLESPNAKAGVKGLAGDLHAVSAIRRGIRAANYALSKRGNSMTRSEHQEVVRAAKIIDALPKVPRRCGSNSPSLPMLRTPRQDAWGCPEVTKEEFPQKCLGKTHGKPCVTTPAPAIKLALH
eukprot:symbB.v1.2.017687.t1/scaffold1368.1/size123082/14